MKRLVAHRGFEASRHADVPGEVIERSHWENAQRDVGAGKPPSHGVYSSVSSSGHDRPWFSRSARRQRQYVVAAPRDEDLRLDADLDCDPHDVRLASFT